MFKSEREFRDEDGLDDNVIIDLNDICSNVTLNLNDLEIGLSSHKKMTPSYFYVSGSSSMSRILLSPLYYFFMYSQQVIAGL